MIQDYLNNNWRLVLIAPSSKSPSSPEWNKLENTIKTLDQIPDTHGIGLAHAYSGTMSLDIDDWKEADKLLKEHNINLQDLYNAPDSVAINSGKANRGKLLFAMPFGITLPSKKITYRDDTNSNQVAYELRCATQSGLTVQDVLPPSIHPETGLPYKWDGNGSYNKLPTIPQAILTLWQSLLVETTIKTTTESNASWDEITDALKHISPESSRDEWVQVGMALHDAGVHTNNPELALQTFNTWSAQSETKYKGEQDILTAWNSFKPSSGISLGTLFHLAQQNGYKRPLPSAAELFAPINETKQVEAPVDIMNGLRPPAPDIDLSLWPDVLATRAQEVSEGVGCDPIVPLFAGLGAVCGAVDARIRLEIVDNFLVPPVLWMMTIGDPADKKSPGSVPMFSVLKEIELEDRPRFAQEYLAWEAREAAYKISKKVFLEEAGSAERLLDPTIPLPTVPTLDGQPVPLKITVSDITSQKLVRHAAERPRGLLCYLDEMNSWVKKLTDRSSSEDRSTWTVSYESKGYEMDRVGAGSIHCDNLAVSIYGNIQPKVFKRNVHNLAEDGLVARFIPGVLRAKYSKKGNPVPNILTSKSVYEQMIRRAYSINDQVYKLSSEAYDVYDEFQDWYYEAKKDERVLNSDDVFMTAFGKAEGTAGRLILIFHLIEDPHNPVVSVDIVERVIKIVKSYIIPSFRYVLGEVAGLVDDSLDVWITDHIIHNAGEVDQLSLRDIKRSARRKLDDLSPWQAEDSVRTSMHMLEQCGWVYLAEDKGKHVVWIINPSLKDTFKEYRNEVIRAKQRQLDSFIDSANAKGKKTPRKFVKGFEELAEV